MTNHVEIATKEELTKYETDLLDYSKSEQATIFYLNLLNNKQFVVELISDVVFERLFNLFIYDHKQKAKENAIQIIHKLNRTNKFNSTSLLALEIALKNEKSDLIREYGIKIVYQLVKNHKENIELNLNQGFFNTIYDSLNDRIDIIKYYVLLVIIKLLQKYPTKYEIKIEAIWYADNLLKSQVTKNLNELDILNYEILKLIPRFYLYITEVKHYKLDKSLIEKFSELLLFDYNSNVRLDKNADDDDEKFLINFFSACLLDIVFKKKLFECVNDDFIISNQMTINFQTYFNDYSMKSKKLLNYSLKLLAHLIDLDENLMLENINKKLLVQYLFDKGLNFEQKSAILSVLGSIYRQMTEDDEYDEDLCHNSQDFIDFLFDSIDNQILCQNVLILLKQFIELKLKFVISNLTSINLNKVIILLDDPKTLNSTQLKNFDKIRKLACSIICSSIKIKPLLLADNVLRIFKELILNSDLEIINEILFTIRSMLENYNSNQTDADNKNIQLFLIGFSNDMKSHLIQCLTINQNHEILCLNVVVLLKLFLDIELKSTEQRSLNRYKYSDFTSEDLDNLALQLESNFNEVIRGYCFEILQLIHQKQRNFPSNILKLIKIEKISIDILASSQDVLLSTKLVNNNLINNLVDMLFDIKMVTINLFEALDKLLQLAFATKKFESVSVSIVTFLLIHVQNGHKLISTLIETLCKILIGNVDNEQNELDDLLIQVLYYVCTNGQLLNDDLLNNLKRFLAIPSRNKLMPLDNFCIFTIKIYRLLASRNQIGISDGIYENIIKLLSNEKNLNETECKDSLVNLIEIVAYSIQNNDKLPSNKLKLVKTIESYFQKNTCNIIKYYNCLALNSFVEKGMQLEAFTLELLKLYAQSDNEVLILTESLKSSINLRDISIRTLENYLKYVKFDEKNMLNMIETREIIDEEKLGSLINDYTKTIDVKIQSAKRLFAILKEHHVPINAQSQSKLISTYNLNVLIKHLQEENTELKIIILEILELIANFLQTNQIDIIIEQLTCVNTQDTGSQMIIDHILKIIEKLIKLRKSIDNEASIEILINFMNNEMVDQQTRFKLIDLFELLLKYQTIEIEKTSEIKLLIVSKKLIKLHAKPVELAEKQKLVDDLVGYLFTETLELTINTVEAFEILLRDTSDSIRDTILHTIELIIQNKSQTQNNFVNESNVNLFKKLFITFNQLLNENKLDKSKLLNLFNLINKYSNDNLITEEIMNNIEKNLIVDSVGPTDNKKQKIKKLIKIETLDLILKATQNGCKLTKPTIYALISLLTNIDNYEMKITSSFDTSLKLMKIFKNLAENFVQLNEYDEDCRQELDKACTASDTKSSIFGCLEEQLAIDNPSVQQLTLNILKYQYKYKPTKRFFQLLTQILSRHPLQTQIEYLLKCSTNLSIEIFLHLMHIILLSKYFDNKMNDKAKPVGLLCRDLLCTNILAEIYEYDKYDEITKFKFYKNLTQLEEYFQYETYSLFRDEILIFILNEVQTSGNRLKLNDVNEIFLLIKVNDESLDILHANPSDWLLKLKINWLNTIVNYKYKHIKSEWQVPNRLLLSDHKKSISIIDLLLNKLKLGVELSECLLERICDLNSIDELIEFLMYLFEIMKQETATYKDNFNLTDCLFKTIGGKIVIKNIQTWIFDIETYLIKKYFHKMLILNNFQTKSNTLGNIDLMKQIEDNLIKLYEVSKWSLKTINYFLVELIPKSVLNKQMNEIFLEYFLNSLIVINNFSISESKVNKDNNNVISLFKNNKNAKEWPLTVHKFGVSVAFDQDENEKSLNNLIDEIKKNNEKLNETTENLEQKYRNIIVAYNRDSAILPIGKPINKWNASDVNRWSAHYINSPNRSNIRSDKHTFELISVIKRAIYLHTKKHQFEARSIQILSLLFMLDASENNTARLAQIKTGEGKSVIIAMLAAFHALNGHKVDIITTSCLLAKRDAENKSSFYNMLNLTVGDNGGNSSTKPCYRCDVVYGDVNEYQFDILRDEYSLLGTRCGRSFDIAIVDEVDSMLIDDNSKICRLASRMPAMEELEVLLVTIWQELNRIYERLVRIEGKLYCVTVPFKMDADGNIVLLKQNEADENNNNEDDDSDFIEIDNAFEFVKLHLKNYVQNKLLKPNDKNECLLRIPKHLTEFVEQQLDKWILNAWHAKFSYQENIDYLIAKKEAEKNSYSCIVPIDYKNTGIIQTNTTWSDGLHQFLQIKHKLRISAENLTTNFLSNIGYFGRYKQNLFGLTGTLGSTDAKKLLKHIYNVDFVIIPPYKYTQFKAYPDRILYNESEWLYECTKSIYREAKLNQRAVLCICETKSAADQIYLSLTTKDESLKKQIKLYTRSDNDEKNAVDDEVDAGQIIVATNLAGRGTDIVTTHKVEENGGLHVIVTFLPLNTRVELQAFGRTSRQGKRGTAEIMLFDETIKQTNECVTMETLKEKRDKKESKNIQRAIKVELKRIKIRDKLFVKFCQLRKQLRDIEDDEYKLDSIEETWGFWLKNILRDDSEEDSGDDDGNKTSLDSLTDSILDKRFEILSKTFIDDYKTNRIFRNPFYLIKKANHYIFKNERYDPAIVMLEDAIKIDNVFTLNAYYYLAYALIKQSANNKMRAKDKLEKSLDIINNTLIPQYESMMITFKVSNGDKNAVKSDIEEQIMNKINLLCLYKNKIECAIEVIKDAESKKHTVKVDFKKLEDFFSENNKPSEEIDEFKQTGLLGFFELTRKEPTPWLSIIAVGLLGIAQAVAGAALIAFTGGAAINIGMALLGEGIGDIIHAIKSGISGEFSWEDYAIQKAISITITICTCGMGAIKETGRAIQAGAKGTANLIKNIGVKGVSKQVVGQFTKESWKLVGKQIGVAFVKAGAKEVIKTVLDKTILKAISNKINSEIVKNIEDKIQNEVLKNKLITDLLGIDNCFRNTMFKNEIESIAFKLLNPQNSKLINAAIQIAKGIMNQLSEGISGTMISIFTAAKCLVELASFLDEYLAQFKQELNAKLSEKIKLDHLMHIYNNKAISHKTSKEIVTHLKGQKYIHVDGIQVLKPVNQTVLIDQNHTKHENYVREICNTVYTERSRNDDYAMQKNMLSKTLTDALANHMASRINSELINPAVNAGVNYGVDKIACKIEEACASSKGTLKQQLENHRNQRKIMEYHSKLSKEANRNDKNNVKQINKEKNAAVENLAKHVESDSEGGLVELGALSAELKRPIQVFKNGKYDFTIGGGSGGEPIKIDYQPGQNGNVGHWEAKDGLAYPSGPKNCLYDAISAQTNIPSNDLRQRTANCMRENSTHFAKMIPAIERLDANLNKGLLYVGGTNTRKQPPPQLGQNITNGKISDLMSSVVNSFNNFEKMQNPAKYALSDRYDFPVANDPTFNKQFAEADIENAFVNLTKTQFNPNVKITGMRYAYKADLKRNQYNIEGLGKRSDGQIYRLNFHAYSDNLNNNVGQKYFDNQGQYIKTNKPGLTTEQKNIQENKMYQRVRRNIEKTF